MKLHGKSKNVLKKVLRQNKKGIYLLRAKKKALERVQHDYFTGNTGSMIADNCYTLLRLLGQGQFGTVWLAKDNRKRAGRGIVALKISRNGDTYAVSLRREAMVMRQMNRREVDCSGIID